MPIVVGIDFKRVGKLCYFDPGEFKLKVHDAVLVEGERGPEFGVVQHTARAVPDSEIVAPLKRVVRYATEDDFAKRERNERRQAEAYVLCQQKIRELDLPMKLIESEWSFESDQVTFHFVAEGRIDFRQLVREIAGVLHMRVQMHQVGARDHAKVIPGIGPCGRPTCCSTFLREFQPVSIKMAKGQNLSLNPSKFSGLCGKLMCCLRYELEPEETKTPGLPQVGMVVMTPMGPAKVEEVNAIQQMLTVQLETQAFVEVRLKDVGEVPGCVDHTEGDCAGCASAAAASCTPPTPSGPSLPMMA